MKKIIHLSDLHIGYEDCGSRFLAISNKIIGFARPPEDYVLVITGDIVDNANHSKSVSEAVHAIRRLETHGYRVLVIPGNHDYGTGSWGDKRFVQVFKEKYFDDQHVSYPKLDIIDEMAFIGLDSTAEELHWHDRVLSEGELGEDQLRRLKKIICIPEIQDLKKIVYLHHHPFDFKLGMQLKDEHRLKKIIANKIDMILFGHYHSHSRSERKIFHGFWGIPRCYNAGSSTHKNGDFGFHRVIDLSENNPQTDYDGRFLEL